MQKKEALVIVMGVPKNEKFSGFVARRLAGPNREITVFETDIEGETTFEARLSDLNEAVDPYLSQGYDVGIFGISMGGTLAAYQLSKEVRACVTVCSALRTTTSPSSLDEVFVNSPPFQDAVTIFQRIVEPGLTAEQRVKHLAVIPDYDEIMPTETMALPGGKTLAIPTPGHYQAILSTVSSRESRSAIQTFLRERFID